ncbi:MAG: polyhydroxyalkanoate synthesis repressor PhaR [Gammaproteobacteria bacterium]|nr:polyhydroxyalkanoate synthesis repressor PhaR [Gammaproteobacteria bacterium]
MPDSRLIKKYPNRRLYDTQLSKYITLTHVRDLVLQGVELRVVDAVSEEEITRQILMQIINEQENGDSPLFSTETLAQFIRLYQNAVPDVFAEFMERSLNLFTEQQKLYEQQLENALGTDPVKAFSELTEHNLAMWKDMQENWLRMAGIGAGNGSTKRNKK